jgi:trehalose 6-phosphate phosphatase
VNASIDLNKYAILLDVDGTILDIAPTPHEVRVPKALSSALQRISERTKGALALVSGRPLGDLDFIFAPLRLPAIGGHGAEIRPVAGGKPFEQRARSLDRELRSRLSDVAKLSSGIIVEDKGYALALHYRLAIDKEADVRERVVAICSARPSDAVEILPGKAVIEIKSAGFNKGTAVRELMTYPPFADRCPIFIGDDTTDEAAFAVLPDFGGLGISVGRKVAGIAGRFQAPSDVRNWLVRIAESDVVIAS